MLSGKKGKVKVKKKRSELSRRDASRARQAFLGGSSEWAAVRKRSPGPSGQKTQTCGLEKNGHSDCRHSDISFRVVMVGLPAVMELCWMFMSDS